MDSKLLPCPFCGGDGYLKHIYGVDGFAFVECLSCGAIGEARKGGNEAIKAWNTRAERTCEGCSYEYTKGCDEEPCCNCVRIFIDLYTAKVVK